MADTNANINLNIDGSNALATIKALQSQISVFHQSMSRSGAAAAQQASVLQRNLVASVNATEKFDASMTRIKSGTDAFTEALEKNQLSMKQYFRYSMGASKTFGRFFKNEWDTIGQVAQERVKDLRTQYVKLGNDASGSMKAIKIRPLTLDMNDLGTKTQVAAQRMQLLNQMVTQGSTAMLNWGKNTQWAGRQLMVGFTIPLIMMGTKASQAFMKIEEQVVKLKRVYGDFSTSIEDTNKIVTSLRGLASEFTKWGVAVEDTMQLAADAAATGKMGADLINQVTEATRLAVLGNVDQQQALQTTMSVTNAFGVATEDLASKIDFLNAVENQSVTSIEDLTVAIPKAAPVVKQLGGNIEDLAFFLTAMKEGGINASEGANALKSGIASMINPSAKASAFMKDLGINVNSIVKGNAGDVKGMIMDMASALDQLNPLQRAQAIEQMFGKFQFSRISTLFQNVIAQGSQAQRVLGLTKSTSEELAVLSERELKRVEESTAFKWKKAMEDFNAALAPVGEQFLKSLIPVIDGINSILKNFNGMSDGAKQFVSNFLLLFAGLGPAVLMAVGLIANGLANLVKGFQFLRNVFTGAGGESRMLGEQTQYMSSKQLEAATIAASLNQVHSNLIQTYGGESSALQILIGRYEQAIVAQRQFQTQRATTGSVPPTGFATGGVVKGPGGPKSDMIPANLSDGEAVIPADAVKRNPGIIQALIGGKKINVAGFYGGGVAGFQETHVAAPLMQTDAVLAEMDKIRAGFSQLPPVLRETMVVLSDLTATKSTTLNQLAKNQGMSSTDFTTEWNRNAGEGFKAVGARAQAAGQLGAGPEIDAALTQLDTEVGQRVAEKIDNGNIDKSVKGWLDQLMADVTKTVIDEFQTSGNTARQQVGTALSARSKMPVTARSVGVQNIIDPNTGQPYGNADSAIQGLTSQGILEKRDTAGRPMYFGAGTDIPFGRTTSNGKARSTSFTHGISRGLVPGGSYETGVMPLSSLKTTNPIQPAQDAAQDATAYSSEMKKELDKPSNDAYPLFRQRNSPHPLAGPDGADDAIAYTEGFQEKAKTTDIYGGASAMDNDPSPYGNNAPATPKRGGFGGFFDSAKAKIVDSAKSTATAIGNKAAGMVVNGFNNLKNKASEAVVAYFEQAQIEGIAAADINSARHLVIQDYLMATDQEYAAWNAEKAMLEKQLQEKGSLNQQEQALLDEINAMLQEKRAALAAEADMNQETIQQTQARLSAQSDGLYAPAGVAKTKKTNPATQAARQKVSGALGKVSMGLMSVGMLASFIPGEAGQAIQGLMPGLMGLSAVLPLITSPMGALAVALAAIVAGFIILNGKIVDAAKEMMDLKSAVGASKDSIGKIAEYTGKVTAGEYMNKVRENRQNLLYRQQGKSTFGQTFMGSESGKSMANAAKMSLSTTGIGQAGTVEDLSSQLITAVMSGVLNKDQAQSIAAQLGKELDNTALAIQINAKLNQVLGPNGENLAKDPLNIAMAVTKSNQQKVGTTAARMNELNGVGLAAPAMTAGAGVAGAVAGGLGGLAIAGSGMGAAMGAMGSAAVLGPVGIAVGAIAGTVAMGFALSAEAERIGKVSGAIQQDFVNILASQQEAEDSLDAYYDKKVKEAELQGNIAQAIQLQAEWESKKNTLSEQGAGVREDMMAAFDKASTGVFGIADQQAALIDRAKESIKSIYKDSPEQLSYFDSVSSSLQDRNKFTRTQEYMIVSQIQAKNITPQQVSDLMGVIGQTADGSKAVADVIVNFGGGIASELSGALKLITGPNGEPATDLQVKVGVAVSQAKTSTDAENILKFVEAAGTLGGVMQTDILVDVGLKDKNVMTDVQDMLDTLDTNEVTTVEKAINLIPNIINEGELQNFSSEYFNSLGNETQQETYVRTISLIMEIPDPELVASADFQAWMGENGYKYPGDISLATLKSLYAEATAQTVTEANPVDVAPKNKKSKTGGGGGGGVQASFLDDIVSKMKQFVSISIPYTEGWDASRKAMENFFESGKIGYNGLSQTLLSAGANLTLIDAILGMSPEEYNKYIGQIFNGNKLTAFGRQMQKALNAIAIGQYIDSQIRLIATSNDSAKALKNLARAGLDVASSYDIIQDAALASAIAHAKNERQVRRIVKVYYAAQKAIQDAMNPDQLAILKANVEIGVPQAEIDQYNTGLSIIGLKEDEINKKYDERATALQEIADLQAFIAQRQKAQLTLADALTRGDISAAAVAMQDYRSQSQQFAADQQNKALEQARQEEIKGLTVEINGVLMSREEIEQQITDRQEEIYQIQLDQIDAANIRLAQQEQEKQNNIDNAKALKNLAKISGKLGIGATTGSGGSGSNKDKNKNKNKNKVDVIKPENVVETGVSMTQAAAAAKKNVGTFDYKTSEINGVKQYIDPNNNPISKTEYDKAYQDFLIKTKNAMGQFQVDWNNTLKSVNGGAQLTNGNLARLAPTFKTVVDGLAKQTKGNIGLAKNQDELAAELQKAGYKVKDGKVTIKTASGDIKVSLENVGKYIKDVGDNSKKAQSSVLTLAQQIWKTNRAAGKTNGGPFPVATGGLMTKMGPIYRSLGGGTPNFAAIGTDIIPAMLTPGEFIVSRPAVKSFGVENLKAINNGEAETGSMYNSYSISVNVSSMSDPDQIARAVMQQIKRTESYNVQGVRR